MDNLQSIFNFDDTGRALERPSVESALEHSATIQSRNSLEPELSCTPLRNLGSLNQRLNANRELSRLQNPSIQSSIAKKGFCCVNGSEGLKYFLDGRPIIFNSYLPAWERTPSVSSESYLKNCLKRAKGFDSDSLRLPKKIREYKPKQSLIKVSCLSLNVALHSGLLAQDLSLFLNPQNKHKLGTQASDISLEGSCYSDVVSPEEPKNKQFYTPETLSKFWGQKQKVIMNQSHSEAVKGFPKVLCSVQFFSDQADKDQIRQIKLRLLR